MVKVTSKDKMLEVEAPQEIRETAEDAIITETENKETVYEEAPKEISHNPPKHITLTEMEYGAVSKTLQTIGTLKETISGDSEETKAQINMLEVSIWDDIVKRFGFESVETASEAGFTFGLKRLYVAECTKK